jgi:hypothetical protein
MTTHFETFIKAFCALDTDSRFLDGDYILCPPSEDFGYENTPRNALTFASMGVDGVHYAVLRLKGAIRDDSPVVQVSPMDSDDVLVLAESFLQYLADGCQVPTQTLLGVFEAERKGNTQLVPFLTTHFEASRLLDDERTKALSAKFRHLIEPKSV